MMKKFVKVIFLVTMLQFCFSNLMAQPDRVEQLLLDFHNNHLGGTDYSEKIDFPKPLTDGQKKAYKGLVFAIGSDAAILISGGSSEAVVKYLSAADLASSVIMDFNANKTPGEVSYNVVFDLLKDQLTGLEESVISLGGKSTQQVPGLRTLTSAGFVVYENVDAAVKTNQEILAEVNEQKEILNFAELISTDINELKEAISWVEDEALKKEYENMFAAMVQRKAELAVYKQRVIDNNGNTDIARKVYDFIDEGSNQIAESSNFALNLYDYIRGRFSEGFIGQIIDNELKRFKNTKRTADEIIELGEIERLYNQVNEYGGYYLKPDERINSFADLKDRIPEMVQVGDRLMTKEDLTNTIGKYMFLDKYDNLRESIKSDKTENKIVTAQTRTTIPAQSENDNNDFLLTKSTWSINDDWSEKVRQEFGAGYRVADEEDIRSYYRNNKRNELEKMLDDLGLDIPGVTAFVSKNGKTVDSNNSFHFVYKTMPGELNPYEIHGMEHNHPQLELKDKVKRILVIKSNKQVKREHAFRPAFAEGYSVSGDEEKNLNISDFQNGQFKFQLEVATASGCIGEVEGTASFQNNAGYFKDQYLELRFQFSDETVTVEEKRLSMDYSYSGLRCGFAGTYRRPEKTKEKKEPVQKITNNQVVNKPDETNATTTGSGNLKYFENDLYSFRYPNNWKITENNSCESKLILQNQKRPEQKIFITADLLNEKNSTIEREVQRSIKASTGIVGANRYKVLDKSSFDTGRYEFIKLTEYYRTSVNGAEGDLYGLDFRTVFENKQFVVSSKSKRRDEIPEEVLTQITKSLQLKEKYPFKIYYSNSAIGYITDSRDGRTYKTIKIGSQVWMAENLKATKLNDGSALPNVTRPEDWMNSKMPAYCWYDNNQHKYGETYGALYNGYTIETDKLCPAGWHVPTDDDWEQLEIFLGMSPEVAELFTETEDNYVCDKRGEISNVGGKLKAKGTTHWTETDYNVTNGSGFSGLPAGGLIAEDDEAEYNGIGGMGAWWSSTGIDDNVIIRLLSTDEIAVFKLSVNKNFGLPVRCLKD